MSKNPSPNDESDFSKEMEALVAEVGQAGQAKGNSTLGFLQLLRPVVLGMEGLGRATVANSQKIDLLLEKIAAQPTPEPPPAPRPDPKDKLNQQLFDALHEELRGYKDNFLLEILQKPIILDLIVLYDDLSEIHGRLDLFLKQTTPTQEFHRHLAMSLDHAVSSVLETLARLDVVRMEPSTGKLDSQKHRAVSVIEADTPAENGEIAQSLKPCFIWKDRRIRPEEVILKKWSPKA